MRLHRGTEFGIALIVDLKHSTVERSGAGRVTLTVAALVAPTLTAAGARANHPKFDRNS